MNYYITHSDRNFVGTSEKLFDSLALHSKHKILYFTVNFDYDASKYDNVIPIRIDSEVVADSTLKKVGVGVNVNMLFFKSRICWEALKQGNHQYCYLDSDCMALDNCDEVFNDWCRIKRHPLLNRNVYDFMICDGKGSPSAKGGFDLTLCVEYPLFTHLGVDIKKRPLEYRQSNIILFNNNCSEVIEKWKTLCEDPLITNNSSTYAPMGDETVLNTLLWAEDFNDNLGYISVNIPSNVDGVWCDDKRVRTFIDAMKSPTPRKKEIFPFCEIPSSDTICDLKFLHGRTTPSQQSMIQNELIVGWKRTREIPLVREDVMFNMGARFPTGRGVEVGTFKGEFSKEIMNRWGGTLYMVDVWRGLGDEYNDISDHGDNDFYREAMNNTMGFEDRAIMIRATSIDAAKIFADNTLDFVYIDANHAYDFVREDIQAWLPKIKSGGYLCGHDYLDMDWYNDPNFAENGKDKFIYSNGIFMGVFGVNPAVDEFCKEHGYTPTITTEWFGSWFIQIR